MRITIEKMRVTGVSMTHMIVTVLAVALFVTFVLVPGYVDRLHMKQRAVDIRYLLNEHKSLQPLYESLKKSSRPDFTDLVVSPMVRIRKDDIMSALSAIRNISVRSEMKFISLVPDLNRISKDPSSLALNLSIKGNFDDFRKVLADIGALPYVESVQEFSIQRDPDSQMVDLKIKIILGVG